MKKTSFHLKLRPEVLAHLRAVAESTGLTMTALIESALEDRFAGVNEEVTRLRQRLAAAGMQ